MQPPIAAHMDIYVANKVFVFSSSLSTSDVVFFFIRKKKANIVPNETKNGRKVVVRDKFIIIMSKRNYCFS